MYYVQTTCRIKEQKFYETHWHTKDADRFAKYLNYLPYNEHLLVVTLGDAFANMTARAYDALCSVGIDIGDIAREGQTFVALIVIGSHCKTMYELYEDDLAYLHLQLNGKCNHHIIIIQGRNQIFISVEVFSSVSYLFPSLSPPRSASWNPDKKFGGALSRGKQHCSHQTCSLGSKIHHTTRSAGCKCILHVAQGGCVVAENVLFLLNDNCLTI